MPGLGGQSAGGARPPVRVRVGQQNRGSVVLFTGTTGAVNQASKWGAGVWLIPAAAGNAFSYGTWAVTAPNGTSPSRVAPDATGGPVAGG